MNKTLKYILIIVLAVSVFVFGYFALGFPGRKAPEFESATSDYEKYINNLRSVLPPDRIPPLESPEYIKVEDSHFMADDDMVFVLEADEGVFIYPQKIMVWHEVVNETIDGNTVSVTYCPLTGSAIGYKGDSGDIRDNTYGTSGSLVNSNLVLYDRETESYIPQILGVGINSGLEGVELDTIPVHWAKWSDAIRAYPDAKVLAIKTGYQRDYFTDPYGSYREDAGNTYYQVGEPMFDVLNDDDGIFNDKKVVVGVKNNGETSAIDPEVIKSSGSMLFNIGGENAVAFYDESLNTVRVHHALEDGSPSDEPMTYFDVMWFAWYAYYPDTSVIR